MDDPDRINWTEQVVRDLVASLNSPHEATSLESIARFDKFTPVELQSYLTEFLNLLPSILPHLNVPELTVPPDVDKTDLTAVIRALLKQLMGHTDPPTTP